MSDNWQNRIEKFEQTPPPGVWEHIAMKLDEESNLQNRLLNYEEMPPAAVWSSISSRLDADDDKPKIISVERNKDRKIVWRIAVAASVISVVLLSVFYFNKKGTAAADTVITTTATPKISDSNNPALQIPETNSAAQTISPVAKKETKKIATGPAKKTIPVNSSDPEIEVAYIQPDEMEPLAGPPVLDPNKKLVNDNGEETNDIAMMNTPGTYIMITGPNGDQVRVSSKFSKLIGYINDKLPSSEEYIDKVIKESKFWRGKFKAWRDKMISNTIAPSPDNFMDIIELSKLVKE